MARSSKALQSAAGAGVEAQAFAARMVTLQADAGLTIAMRMPMLLKGALGDSRGQREAAKAVTEKVSAVMESGFAAVPGGGDVLVGAGPQPARSGRFHRGRRQGRQQHAGALLEAHARQCEPG
jgi:hypothetical protein